MTADHPQEPGMQFFTNDETTTSLPAERPPHWHHPHYVSHTDTGNAGGIGNNRYTFIFRTFSRYDAEPALPEKHLALLRRYDDAAASDEIDVIYAEVHAARRQWYFARFIPKLTDLITAGAPLWDQMRRTQEAARAAFQDLYDIPDRRWRAGLLVLATARQTAIDATLAFQDHAHQILYLFKELEDQGYGEYSSKYEERLTAAMPGYRVYQHNLYEFERSDRTGPFMKALAAITQQEDTLLSMVARFAAPVQD